MGIRSLSPETILAWQRARGWRRTVLAGTANLYRAGAVVRNLAYDTGMIPTYRASVPVVSVGNLEAGGTGKTPIVRLLVGRIRARVAVVMRGYGNRLRRFPHVVSRKDPASLVGDEACLLKRWLPRTVVVVDRNRRRAVSMIGNSADCIVLDDGFQHRSLHRELDVVVVPPDPSTRLLPWGMAREPISSLRRATLLWVHGGEGRSPVTLPAQIEAVTSDLPRVVSRYRLEAIEPYSIWRSGHAATAAPVRNDMKWYIVTGIARPDRVGRLLKNAGHTVVGETWCPDHGFIDTTTLVRAWDRARRRGATGILTTEKDAIRYDGRPFEGVIAIPLYVVRVSVDVVRGSEILDTFVNCIGGT